MQTPFVLFLGDLGGGEIMLIMVVILIFFGANKIPELARGLGKGIREFKDASTPTVRSTGVSIEVKEAGRLERENTAYIDSDEIQSLLAGIDYIAKASAAVTALSSFEVEYRTKGDFRVTVFNDNSGKLSAAVSAGRIGKTSAYLSMGQLQELRALILTAKGKVAD